MYNNNAHFRHSPSWTSKSISPLLATVRKGRLELYSRKVSIFISDHSVSEPQSEENKIEV
ncbi:CLUMA_CG021129, isoform A [Clunio marinus]|uniref:CLUMA_CG021129, isoform A n=1 Tax=Clunio marinus TaxID=568069 RepID=A0A1J1JB33_9DIPT|nr:CLUMA_CG021129, isoform A [Clunio marinus]